MADETPIDRRHKGTHQDQPLPPKEGSDYLANREPEKFSSITKRVNAMEQKTRILTLVRRGATGPQVCDVLSADGILIDPKEVYRLVEEHLTTMASENRLGAEQLRQQENERLDEVMKVLYPKVLKGDLKAIDRFTRLSERRAKMNGLDQPQRLKLEGTIGLDLLGVDPNAIQEAEEAFVTAYSGKTVDSTATEITGGQNSGEEARTIEGSSEEGRANSPLAQERAFQDQERRQEQEDLERLEAIGRGEGPAEGPEGEGAPEGLPRLLTDGSRAP